MPEPTHPSGEVFSEDSGRLIDFPRQDRIKPLSNNNLPLQLTSFIGREREIADLKELLVGEARLVTLTGPGGSGKTRLALSVASGLAGEYEDGVWLVELAPLSDPDLMPQAVANALGVREAPGRSMTDMLVEHLQEQEVLLLLDNCEHLVGACAALCDTLLRACPNLKILATSRETLEVAGERNWPVPSLSSPDPRSLPQRIEELGRIESVRLFVERARYRKPDFELNPENASSVAEMCRGLDGIPLAIELAAARVGTLSVAQISDRLGYSLELLSSRDRTVPERQRTLWDALEWSYELLEEDERGLFGRLSVFAGGFTLDAAEAVCEGDYIEEGDVLDPLSRLVDKSLVITSEQDGEARYQLLEPVRQYGWEKLKESGKAEEVRRRHAEHYLALAEMTESGLSGPERARWLERLEKEHDNFRAALSWSLNEGSESLEERAELGLRLTVALWRFWDLQGSTEGHRWVDTALEKCSRKSTARAKALNGAGWTSMWAGDYHRATSLIEEGISLFEELGDTDSAAISLAYLGMTMVRQEDAERTAALRDEADSMCLEPSLGHLALAELLFFLASASAYDRDYLRSIALFEESLAVFRDLEDARGTSRCVVSISIVSILVHDIGRARDIVQQGLESAREVGDKPGTSFALLVAASLAGGRGGPARAARLWGAAEALREAIGISLGDQDPFDYDYEGRVATARAQLEEAAWEAAWNEGRAMSPEQAIEYALHCLAEQEVGPILPETYPAGLSDREVDVLRLVARGLTNAQIARELFISPNTVNRHLNSIYHKIGVSSRAAATRFALEHNLL